MTTPSAPSVALRYAAARVAASPFSELSPEGSEAFGAFCRSLTYWLGMAQYANLDEMYTANLDMMRHYRPGQNVLSRPVQKGHSFEVIGHHEITLPLLRMMILEMVYV